MHLIDDIHLIAAALRQIHRTFPEIPDVLHAVVGRCVDLDDVCQRSTLCVPADLAFQTGIPFRVRCSQFTVFARIRAQVVFPVPREPVKR